MDRLINYWGKSGTAFRLAIKFGAGGAFLVSLFFLGLAGLLAILNSSPFWGSILQNLFAEFFGLAFGILFAAVIAREVANQKLDELAPELIALIARLRRHGVLDGPAARSCVICAAKFLSEENLQSSRDKNFKIEFGMTCPVCKEKAPTERPDDKGGWRCKLCDLDSGVWNVKLGPEDSTVAGATRQATVVDDAPKAT